MTGKNVRAPRAILSLARLPFSSLPLVPMALAPMALALAALHPEAAAQQAPPPGQALRQASPPAVTRLTVQAAGPAGELVCDRAAPAPRPPAAPNADPMEVPTEETIEELAPAPAAAASAAHAAAAPAPSIRSLPSNGGYRIAIWGDSHLAANFFGEEVARLLNFPAGSAPDTLVPANMGRAGVRLPLRQSCVSPQWKYELVYLGGEQAAAPGPGLVNMTADQPGATLAWDVRRDAGAPGYARVRILYQQTDAPLTVGISVDGGAEQEVALHERAGPAVLELAADRPMAQVKLRLVEGRLRFHGLELASPQADPAPPASPQPGSPQQSAPQPGRYVFDVFGYPGATVAGWKNADLGYLGAWFAQRPYQLVMLEFGTNEGNVKPFDLAAYRSTLSASVRNMKTLFPAAACVLISPGDRGVLVPRSANLHRKGAAHGRKAAAKVKRTAAPDLYQYARIHAAIGRVQEEVAQEAGCTAWSMQDAMGGQGSAYAWARQSPPLMARDLIHFTAAGYRRLAQQFARDMGWSTPAAGTP